MGFLTIQCYQTGLVADRVHENLECGEASLPLPRLEYYETLNFGLMLVYPCFGALHKTELQSTLQLRAGMKISE